MLLLLARSCTKLLLQAILIFTHAHYISCKISICSRYVYAAICLVSQQEWFQRCLRLHSLIISSSHGMWAIARCLYAHGVTCKVSVMRPWQTSGTKYGKSTPPQSPSFSSWHKSEKLCTPSLLPRRSTETGKHDQSQKLWQNGLRKGRPMVLFFFSPQDLQSGQRLDGMQRKY